MTLKDNFLAVYMATVCVAMALQGCSKTEPPLQTGVSQGGPEAATPLAYITNPQGPVAFYSLPSFSRLGEVVVGKGAYGAGLTSDGQFLVVAVSSTNDLAIVNTTTHRVERRIPVGINPGFVRVQGNLAFVVYQPEGEEAPVPSQIAVIDVIQGKKIRQITTGFETGSIEFSADGKQIIATNEADENLTVHDIATGEKIKQIDTRDYGIRPLSIKRSPNGEQFVVTLEYSNRLLILDKDYKIINDVPTGEVPYGVTYNRNGSEIIVVLSRGNAIQVFDTETLTLQREIPVGDHCRHFSFTPDDQKLILACGLSGNILVLDYATGAVLKNLPEKKTPWGVMVAPKSVGSLD